MTTFRLEKPKERRSRMAISLSDVRWIRVLLAVAAVHVANVVVSVVLIVAYSLLAGGPQGAQDGGSMDRFAALFSTWTVPVLTLPSAFWAARAARPYLAIWHGLAVGVLVAGVFGVLFYWPNDPSSAALFVLTIAAGLVGGVIGRIGKN
jgi:hypothetical protein